MFGYSVYLQVMTKLIVQIWFEIFFSKFSIDLFGLGLFGVGFRLSIFMPTPNQDIHSCVDIHAHKLFFAPK
jgi:hypothetical protein